MFNLVNKTFFIINLWIFFNVLIYIWWGTMCIFVKILSQNRIFHLIIEKYLDLTV